MYRKHFGLRADPFQLHPSLKFVFLSTPFEEAMAHLAFGLEQEEDIVLISGPIGTGKTLAVQSLIANAGTGFRSAFVNVTQVDFPELMKLLLGELGAPLGGRVDRADLITALKAQIKAAQSQGQKLLLIVDEAQNLSVECLEGLRLLTNLGQPGGQALQLVLVGQEELERRVNLPELAQLRQRIRVHYRLTAMERSETEAYLRHRLEVAGCARQLFSSDAIDLIHQATAGIPRLVNVLAGRALLSAFVAGRADVRIEDIETDELPSARPVGPAMGRPSPPPATPARVAPAPGPVPPVPAAPVVRAVSPTVAPATPTAPALPAKPATPAPAPDSAPALNRRSEKPAARPQAPTGGAQSQPFDPTASFRARNRRSLLFFLLAIAVLGIAVIAVFSMQASRGDRTAQPASPAADILDAGQPNALPPSGSGEVGGKAPAVIADSLAADVAALPARFDSSLQADLPPSRTQGGSVVPGAQPQGGGVPMGVTPAPGDRADSTGRDPAGEDRFAGFAVHVHSFRDMDRTATDIARLRSGGYPAYFRTVVVDGAEWQRVYAGPYGSLDEAQAAATRLRAEGWLSYALVVRLGSNP